MKRDDRKGLGRHGEDLASRLLTAKGHTLLARNWRSRAGELDLVTQDGDCLVCVEVRTRRGDRLGPPEESITPAKQARLMQLADEYVAGSDWKGDWRIDVVAIEMDQRGRLLRVDHYENAVPC